jgi:hypothetical protein
MTTTYPYNIAAHQHRVADLPKALLLVIRSEMQDTSDGDEESAKFEALLPTQEGKALRLWIDHKEKAQRCEDDNEFRFYLNYVDVSIDHPSYTPEDFAGFIDSNESSFFVSNDYDELAKELSALLPLFKAKYKVLVE